jgi:hypothetical protein
MNKEAAMSCRRVLLERGGSQDPWKILEICLVNGQKWRICATGMSVEMYSCIFGKGLLCMIIVGEHSGLENFYAFVSWGLRKPDIKCY